MERARVMESSVGISRPPAAAFREQHQRQSRLVRDLEHPIFLAMVLMPLRAGQHGVVVRHDDAARFRRLEKISVDTPKSRDESVRRSIFYEVLNCPPPSLRRNHDRPILDERSRIAQ